MAILLLLVDDDADDRELFAEALASVDSTITCSFSENAEEALAKLGAEKDQPNLIFLDINLPGMSGWECLKRMKGNDQFSNIPVVIYTTSSHQRDKQVAEDLGALCLITKPSDYKQLINLLDAIITHVKNGSYSSICGNISFN